MVIKTEVCSFSEFRIFPGHGIRYIRRDGSSYVFISSKSKSLFLQRKKPAKLKWTISWRRMNKKMKVEESSRRRTRKTTKFQRAIIGVSIDEIKKKRTQKPEVRAAAREAALREAKDRSKTKKAGSKGPTGVTGQVVKNAPRAQNKTGNRGKM